MVYTYKINAVRVTLNAIVLHNIIIKRMVLAGVYTTIHNVNSKDTKNNATGTSHKMIAYSLRALTKDRFFSDMTCLFQ